MITDVTFDSLGISPETLETIKAKGFTTATNIQAKVIPLLLEGKIDVIGQANTWTWKTVSFWIPIIEHTDTSSKNIQSIVLTPTRELAIQVAEEIESLSPKGVKTALVYGGQNIWKEMSDLRRGPQILVWTPGRVKDHLKRGSIKLNNIKHFVLDEADEMLNIGFREEIEEIMEQTNENKRVLLFSATLPKAIMNIVKNYMREYELVSVINGKVNNDLIDQRYYSVRPSDKPNALLRILDIEYPFYGIIFCRTKRDVDSLVELLITEGFKADWVHWDIEQKKREKILNVFKDKKIDILVATDVAARWLDVDSLTHVINYCLPEKAENYTHRIGRTWRGWKTWTAISFVSRSTARHLYEIEAFTGQKIKEEKFPTIENIVELKVNRVATSLSDLSKEEFSDNTEMLYARLTENIDKDDLIKTLLNVHYRGLLEIKEDNVKEDSLRGPNNKIRLFIAKGRNDWYMAKEIVSYLEEISSLRGKDIDDVATFDTFSYATVPMIEGEILIKNAKKDNSRKPLIVKAKERGGSSRGWNSRWGRSGWRTFGSRGWNSRWGSSRSGSGNRNSGSRDRRR